MEQNEKLFFVGLKAFIEKEGKLLILRESERPGYQSGRKWEVPGGRIQHDEDHVPLKDVLLREVKEECGSSIRIQVGDVAQVFQRQFPNGAWVFLVGYYCQYLSGEIELSDEHIEYAWITESDLDTYDFVNGYKEALAEYFKKRKIL